MQGAREARVSTPQQPQEGPGASQGHARPHAIHHQGWSLRPAPAYRDEGIRGARLDRPALDRLRDGAPRGACEAVVVWSPDRLARHSAPQGLLIEACTTLHLSRLLLQHPGGDTPQGTRRPQRQGRIAAEERAQSRERTRRGRLEKARRGDFLPWADSCDGSRDRPTRHGAPPQVIMAPAAAAVVQARSRALGEDHRRGRQLAQRLNASQPPPPSGKTQVWPPATGSRLLTHRV